MTEIRLPETLRYIGQSAFERTDLAAIDLPASVVQIEIDAFYICESLKTVTGGENVRYISNDAFWSTPWFSKQPSGLIYLGKAAMCRSLPKQARLTVRPGTFGLADGLFNGTNAFSELVLPSSIGYIGKNVSTGATKRFATPAPRRIGKPSKRRISTSTKTQIFNSIMSPR